jgi:hypothetical protein
VAVVVGEGGGHEVHRDRIQFDRVDVRGLVVKRRQHLVSAGRTDDGLLLGRGLEDVEGDRAGVLGEVVDREERQLPVPPVDVGTQDPVVVHVELVGEPGEPRHVDPEDGAPAGEHHVRRGDRGLAGVEPLVGECSGKRDEERRPGDKQHRDGTQDDVEP